MTDPSDPRVVVVVGGTSGIGLAAAQECARHGDAVVLVAREGGAFDAAADAVRASAAGDGRPAVDVRTIAADVNDVEALQRMVDEVLDAHGRIDAVVHTATVMGYGTIEKTPLDVFTTVVDTAVHGTVKLAHAVLPVFRRQHHGTFVIVNSLLGSITVPNMGAYATSKWGQRAVARTLQQELRDESDVHVCIVSPGSINTPIYYQGANYTGREARPPIPVLQPRVAGKVIARLLDHPRNHVSVPVGPVNPIAIAGYRFLPALYDLMVGPLFRLAALTKPRTDGAGNTGAPDAPRERLHGHWPDRH